MECTASSGIIHTYRNGEEAGRLTILESLGGGVAICDFDRDGLDDAGFTGGGTFSGERTLAGLPAAMFRATEPWRYEPVSEPARLNHVCHYSHGVQSADCDGDGFCDLLITGFGGLQLWMNLGDATFHDVTAAAGLHDTLWSSSAAWGDVNRDGNLDLYVTHYVNWSFDNDPPCTGARADLREVCAPRAFAPLPDTLYLSKGDGTFRDASMEWELRQDGKGLGVLLVDLDQDRDLDLYVTNDTVDNHLYENVDGRTFRDLSLISGASLSDRGTPDGSMGVDVFDFNRDGRLDLWVANFESESCALYENTGRLMFRHVSQLTGVTAVGAMYVGWGSCCFDADLDGDEDVFVSNGHAVRYPRSAPVRQVPLLFENLNGRRFENAAPQAGDYLNLPHMGRGAACGDLDSDGDLDLIVSHINEPAAVLRNETEQAGHWLEVELSGTTSSRDAIGTVVSVQLRNGTLIRQWRGGGSYASTNSRRLHFGLGDEDYIQKLEVRWPSGIDQTLDAPAVNRLLRLVEPDPAGRAQSS